MPRKPLCLVLLAVALLLAAQLPAIAAQLHGVVTSVNAPADRLMVSSSKAVIHVTPQTNIMMNGKQVDLSQLKTGDQVTVDTSMSGGRHVASSIDVMGSSRVAGASMTELHGVVTSVNPRANRLMVSGSGQVIHVTRQTQIMSNGRQARLSQLKTGEQVTVSARMSGQRLVAQRIEHNPSSKMSSASLSQTKTVVTAVNPQANRLMVAASPKVIHVDSNTRIMSQGQATSLADLHTGQQVTISTQRSGNRLIATNIDAMPSGVAGAQEQQIEGTVSSYDADSGQLMLSGVSAPIMVNDQTQVMMNGRAVAASQLKQGDKVQVMTKEENGEQVATRIDVMSDSAVAGEQQTQLEGNVSSYNADTGQLMLSGVSNPVMVTDQTEVMMNGQAADLSQLKAGDQVRVMTRMENGEAVATQIEIVQAAPAAPAETTEPPAESSQPPAEQQSSDGYPEAREGQQ